MRNRSLALATIAALASAGMPAATAAGGVSVWSKPAAPLRPEGYGGDRKSRRAIERAAAKRARRAARNLRNAGR